MLISIVIVNIFIPMMAAIGSSGKSCALCMLTAVF